MRTLSLASCTAAIPSGRPAGRHDLRVLVAEAVRRLPKRVHDWLLYETRHLFIGGHGQAADYFDLYLRPLGPGAEDVDGALRLRIVFLSEQLLFAPQSEVLGTIVKEIAHSRLGHHLGGSGDDAAAHLAAQWGFAEALDRPAKRARRPARGPTRQAARRGPRKKPLARPRKGK